MKRFFQIALVFAISVAANQVGQAALLINLNSATNNSTANTTTGTGTDKREFNSLLSTIQGSDSDSLFIGSQVFISTRLTALTVADKDSNTNTLVSNNTQNATVNYQLNLTVTSPWLFNLQIDTSRIGELTVRNESTGHGGNATLTLGAITATYTGAGTPSGSNNLASSTFTSPNGNNSAQYFNNAVNQSGTVTVPGLIGVQNITLNFSWAQNANSANSGGILSNGQGDDGAIRLGRTTTTNGDAGQYPGNNGRNINLDGHFVTVTATVVPEPSSALLALSGLVGLVGFRRRAC